MWSLIKWLAMRLAVVRWIFKVLGLVAFLPTQTPNLLAAKGLTANIPAAQEVRRRPSAAVAASGRLRGPRLLGDLSVAKESLPKSAIAY